MTNHDFVTEYLDAELNNPSSSAQLDSLVAKFPAEDLIDGGIKGGAIEAFGLGSRGSRSGVGLYTPGLHSHLDILPSSFNSDDSPLLARNPKRRVVPFTSHLILDIPERTSLLSGNFSYRSVANYVLAMTRHVSNTTGGELAVYVNNGQTAGLIYDGDPKDAYIAEANLDSGLGFMEESDASLSGLMKIAESRANTNYDGLFVVSDFQDVFDPKTESFDWQDTLEQVTVPFNDRAWITRVASPAHKALPYDAIEGVDFGTINEINDAYADQAEAKTRVMNQAFSNLSARNQTVDLLRSGNTDHPVNLMTEFILGQVYN